MVVVIRLRIVRIDTLTTVSDIVVNEPSLKVIVDIIVIVVGT